MRSIRLAAFVTTTCLLVACGGEDPAPQTPPPPVVPSATASVAEAPPPAETAPAPPPKPTLAELIPQAMKGIGEAFNAHDAAKVTSYYTDDCVVLGYGEPDAHGREEVQKSLQGLFDTFGDAKSAATRVWIKGNVVISEVVWSATMTGDFMAMKANKHAVGQMRVHVLWFTDDGLVKEVHQYADGAGMMAELEGKPGAPPVPLLPSNPPDVHVAKGSADEDKLADWGKGIDEGLSKDDAKAAAAMMADDGDDWIGISRMPAAKGKKEMAKGLDGWFKAIPDQKWTASNAWGIDGYAIVESTLTGTQKGPLGRLPPSTKPITAWHWLDISQPTPDGKVMHHWGYANLVEMMEETGAVKHLHAKMSGPMTPAGAKTMAAPAAVPAPASTAKP